MLESTIRDIIKQLQKVKGLGDKRAGQLFNKIPDTLDDLPDGSTRKAVVAQDNWTAPSLINSWANYEGGFSIAGYFKDQFGLVHLRGIVKDGSADTNIFVLPAGYRPAYINVFAGMTFASTTKTLGRIDVLADGSVLFKSGGTDFVSLDGIIFRAA